MRPAFIQQEIHKIKLLKIFDLGHDATWDNVVIQHRKLFTKNHPDKNLNNPHAEGLFKIVNTAYEQLGIIYHPTKVPDTLLEDVDPNQPTKPQEWWYRIYQCGHEQIENLFNEQRIKDPKFISRLIDILRNALICARDPDFVRIILNWLPEGSLRIENDKDNHKPTKDLLHHALASRYGFEIIEELLKKGAPVNELVRRDSDHHITPLGIIVFGIKHPRSFEVDQHYDLLVIHLLYQYGMDVNTLDHDGETLLFEAVHQVYSLITQELKKEEDDISEMDFIEILKRHVINYQIRIKALLLYGIKLDSKRRRDYDDRTALDMVFHYKNNISPWFFQADYMHKQLSKKQKKWALQMMDHVKDAINCRSAFDKAVNLINAQQAGYEKYLIEACTYDMELFKQLLHHFLTQQGQFANVKLNDNSEIRKLCALNIVRTHAKEDVHKIIQELSIVEERTFLQIQQNCVNQVKPATEMDIKSKEELVQQYEILLRIKQREMVSFSTLVTQAENKAGNKKTAVITHWDTTFWQTVTQNNSDMEHAFLTLEQQIKAQDANVKGLFAHVRPAVKNMRFFNHYVMDAISNKQSHNLQRVSYCLYFMQNMTMQYEEGNKTKPTIELLKNLYILKGLLLAEVHAQSYFESLFNCAMTSRLSGHVEQQITKIEQKLRNSYQQSGVGIDIENDAEINRKRDQLALLNLAYGTKWRRFKTALIGNKENIHIDQQITEARTVALKNIGL